MPGKWIKVRSNEGGDFDCYLNVPNIGRQVPAVVLASAVHGVDADIIAIAGEFAAHGFIAAAPDLFWRTVPGPLSHDDGRAQDRSQPRLEKIKQGEADMADTLVRLGEMPEFNGSAVAMGFCYGGPYAILGPKRLGYAAGVSCHGTQMLDYVREIEDVSDPVCILSANWSSASRRGTRWT
jgi:carboxymethylenebutenolidase